MMTIHHVRIIEILIAVLVICPTLVRAQARLDSSASLEESDLESLLESDEREDDNSEILDETLWLQDHPLDLNVASAAELAAIPRITHEEVMEILRLREHLRTFDAVEQLALIPHSGEEILGKARTFVVVLPATDDGAITTRFTTRAVRDLQQRKGFLDGRFSGSSLKNYTTLTVAQRKHLEAGILFEKDAGESIRDGFVSGYLAMRNLAFVSEAIVGDYIVEAGQGLVLWRATAPQKGSEGVRIVRRAGRGIRPYRSTDEFHFLRGVAASTNFALDDNMLSLMGFYSKRSLSATVSGESVSTFYEAGLFRTESERKRRNAVTERLAGGRILWRSHAQWQFGATVYHSTFDKPIAADDIFEFSGKKMSAISADAEVNIGDAGSLFPALTFFGELARAEGWAGIAGSILTIQRKANIAMAYRSYSPAFNALHASGFGERSETSNERGFYIAAEFKPAPRLRLSGYVDHFRFPWRSPSVPMPASGRDLLLQMEMSPTRTVEIHVRWTEKLLETSETLRDSFGREQNVMTDRQQRKLRLTALLQPERELRLKSRFEFVNVGYSVSGRRETGFLISQDIRYRYGRELTLEARLAFFHTDSYNSRLYAYEGDLRGVFTNAVLYGRGVRWYFMIRWSPADWFTVSGKYAETRMDGVSSVGSGDSEISGDTDNRLSVQLDVQF